MTAKEFETVNNLRHDLVDAKECIAELKVENTELKKTAFQQGFHIAELQGELSLAQMQKAELVDLLEKSHAE
jgi:hypothetical protein